MKNIQKRKTLITSIAVSLCLLLCAGTLGFVFLQGNENPSLGVFSTAGGKDGIFIPCVMDGRTGEPIEGAKVVIPETGETYTLTAEDTSKLDKNAWWHTFENLAVSYDISSKYVYSVAVKSSISD